MRRVVWVLALAVAVSLMGQSRAQKRPAPAKKRPPGTYAIFQTSMGVIVCKLFTKETPNTVENFIGLAEGTKPWTDPKTKEQRLKTPFYNGTTFHRVYPKFMIQGGDPLANGKGGPGYKFDDEITSALRFDVAGRLAMANSNPNSNGSQFFITAWPATHLDGRHTIFGQVVEGLDLVTKITNVPRDNRDKPKTPVTLIKVTIQRIKK